MKNIKIIIEYSGKNYFGWQKQKNLPTIQGTVESALSSVLCEEIEVTGCSRTDAGVNAINYCANFHSETSIPADRIYHAVHHALPEDILIKSSEEVPDDFHACFSTKSKIYRYYFTSDIEKHPLLADRLWQTGFPLDFDAMKIAAEQFEGTFYFDAFRNADPWSDRKNTLKTIYSSKIFKPLSEYENLYCYEVCGDGFLYNMVRIITGTVAYCGMGKISPDSIHDIILSKDRKKAGVTAPACGLYLYKVNY